MKRVHTHAPLNAETAPAALDGALTPTEVFFARNHGPVPEALGALRVDGLVETPLELSVAELRERFPRREVVATLQCAGNRRQGLIAVREIPGEVPWGAGAIGTARWEGVALADVLAEARPLPEARHVGFASVDVSQEAVPPQPYGASIPRGKAERPEVLLAWGMNGAPLPAGHGGPLRVVVPGYIGARSVKWVERIELRAEPWDGYFQATAYRLLAPGERPAPGAGIALGEVPLTADILAPGDGARVAAGEVGVSGYAFASGGRHVIRVDVTADGGASWTQAELLDDLGPWAWRRWRARVTLAPGEHELAVRAWDSAATAQPEHPASLWNPKGYVNHAWGRVRVSAAP